MDIRQLKYFVAIVDSGSLSKAAERLCVAQPSLSQQVASLESELRSQLLLRSHQGVQPTEAGRALYLRARDVLRQIEQIPLAVQVKGTESGQVAIGLPTSVAVVFALPLYEYVGFVAISVGYHAPRQYERSERFMTTLNPALARVLKRLHYPLDVILTCVRWYVAYPLSLRHLEEMMAERGISVDHSTVHRWAIKVLPVMEKAFRRHKKAVGRSWRMDETYIKVRGQWKYLYRAVDKEGNTVDFLLRAHRDKAAARRYFEKSIEQNGEPEAVTIDKSGANLAALDALNAERETPIKIRQNKYLNNVVEQDHRAIKRRTRPMLGFKNFRCARILLSGIELMHMIAKDQMQDRGIGYSRAQQFYSLAA